MAHRGRLNVLANVIGKNPRQIFREFDDVDPDLHEGKVFVHGEYWDATAPEPLAAGTRVRIEAIQGNTLRVARAQPPHAG